MAINFGNKSVENIQFGNTPIRSVYYGSTKIRPVEPVYPTESIVIKMMANSSGNLKIPVAGNNASASYNWKISVDGGTPITKSGTGSTTPITVATGLTAGSEHTVLITPTTEAYGWARAFGFLNSGVNNLLTEVIYDGSYMGYAESATDTGIAFRFYQYEGCTSLTTAPAEVLPNSVTTIGNMFRNGQYSRCTALTTASAEVLPNSVTTIGNQFRGSQYEGCTSLTTAPAEVLPNSVTSISDSFRVNQYNGCTGLTTVTGIQATPTSVSKGANSRYRQFINAGNTTNKMTLTINGSNIETGATNSLSLANNNVSKIKVASSLVSSYKSSSNWSDISDSKFVSL